MSRKLVVQSQLTLDGVMQAPGGPEEDTSGGFKHGGWSMTYWDETLNEDMSKTMSVPFDLILGRKTYDIFAGYWPQHADEPFGKPLNDATKYVASRGSLKLDWKDSHQLESDVAQAVAKLKEQDGPELQVYGSGDLAQTLMRNNLVDEFHLMVFPLVIGSGKRLFADGTIPAALTLTESAVSKSGVMIGTYVPAGEIVTGSY